MIALSSVNVKKRLTMLIIGPIIRIANIISVDIKMFLHFFLLGTVYCVRYWTGGRK